MRRECPRAMTHRMLKRAEKVEECKKQLEESLADKEEPFKKALLENLQKQLKEIH